MGDVEHPDGGVQPQLVHGAHQVPQRAADEEALDGLEQVRHAPDLLLFQVVLSQVLDKGYGVEHALGELTLQQQNMKQHIIIHVQFVIQLGVKKKKKCPYLVLGSSEVHVHVG